MACASAPALITQVGALLPLVALCLAAIASRDGSSRGQTRKGGCIGFVSILCSLNTSFVVYVCMVYALWMYGTSFYGLMILWFYGFMVLWLYNLWFMVFHFTVLRSLKKGLKETVNATLTLSSPVLPFASHLIDPSIIYFWSKAPLCFCFASSFAIYSKPN